ncbi:phytoene/squalene synthase family protein [Methylobacterium durans]|uniref:phytoene/squalene synthase family protein n=1 Tax=Methylobacterium durans TaxID=2202825 RepID=UPI002AFEE60F|nr:phytoene/squalene synthase family protein [Methylobacterium durans]MEA1830674.1 phytoene/squalene synthase family protein [Methylobacterium durans]
MRASSPDFAERPPAPFASGRDHAACRAAIRQGSRSFHAASLLLPPDTRRAAYGLYAFCRHSDDAVDEARAGTSAAAVVRLQARLARAYAGDPADSPADRALADILAAHAIPRTLPEALLDGLAWDARGRRYETLSDLCAYAARVAASVGAMMTLIMGVRDPEILARACDLGVAMQLTNIARDVGEDARAGRLYLPLRWLAEEGIEPDAFLAEPEASPAIGRLVARLLDAAELLYARSEAGVRGLPPGCRPAIRAARLIYAEIGREIERAGLDSVSRRARVPGRRKAALLARAALPRATVPAPAPCLPETAFLVAAVSAVPSPTAPPGWWDLGGQVVRVLDMIEILREREALARESAP